MDISVRDLLQCVDADLNQDQSILFRLFGYIRSRVPPDPAGVTASVSIRQLANDLEDDHIHINVIRVGFDVLSDTALDDALIELDYSIYRIRNIYRPQGVGVGRVLHWFIDSADADGMDDIGGTAEARDLWEAWSVDNDGIDAFFVRNISGTLLGLAPGGGGECNENSNNDGVLAAGIDAGDESVSRTCAHEVGHFLELPHNHPALPTGPCPTGNARFNLMAQTGCVPFITGTSTRDTRNAVNLSDGQGSTMREHCSIREGC